MAPAIGEGMPYMRPAKKKSFNPWNREKGTFLGRTAKGWGLLLIFYTIFYAVLSAMFAICLYVVLQVVPKDRPMFTLGESLIGTNPGMGFRPNFLEDGSLIAYNANNATQVNRYVEALKNMLQEYDNQTSTPCDFSRPVDHSAQCCRVDVREFGACSLENKFGYDTSQPCVFIKINRIYGWKPEYYTSPEPDMPDQLIKHINSLPANEREQVWVSCTGEDPIDNEHLNANKSPGDVIAYYPSPGIPAYHYPYQNRRGCMSPMVAVKFLNIEVGKLAAVRCRAWAKNIIYSDSLREVSGSTHIEILIDRDPLE